MLISNFSLRFCGILLIVIGVGQQLFAQPYFFKEYTQTYAMYGYIANGAGNDLWMMRDMYNSNVIDTISISHLDSAGNVMHSYVLSGSSHYYSTVGYDMEYHAQSHTLTIVGQAVWDSMGNYVENALLASLDDAGNPYFSRGISSPNARIELYSVCARSGTDIVAAGAFTDFGTLQNQDVFVSRYKGSDGSLLCAARFGSTGAEWADDVVKIPGGNEIVAVGRTNSFGVQGDAIYMVSVDSNCNKLWSLSIDGPNDDEALKVLFDGTDLLIFGGTNSFSTKYRGFVARVSLNGTLLGFWMLDIQDIPYYIRDAKLLNNKQLVMSGSAGEGYGMMMSVDSLFTPLWFRNYVQYEIRSMTTDPLETSIYGCSTIQPGVVATDVALWKVDMNGQGITYCNGPAGSAYAAISCTPTANFVNNDMVTVNPVSQPISMFTDTFTLHWVDGCSGYVSRESPNVEAVQVMPNPAMDILNISIPASWKEDGNVLLLDMAGRTIVKQAIASGDVSLQLNVSEMAAGIYILDVTAGSFHSTNKVVKVRD